MARSMLRRRFAGLIATSTLITMLTVGVTSRAEAAAGTVVLTWDDIAAQTVVKSGAFQNESFLYLAYVSAAVYDAMSAITHELKPYGPRIAAPRGSSAEAAVIEAAYDTLVHYFPAPRATGSPDLDTLHQQALAAIPDSPAKTNGVAVGAQAAADIIALRAGDGRQTPIGVSSSFPTAAPGPGVWRLTPTAFAAAQTPWLAQVQPFVERRGDQFRSKPPPRLSSKQWADAFAEVKTYGAATGSPRSAEQTNTALFYTANAPLQYNEALRDLAASHGMSLVRTTRLMAMVNMVGADAQISAMDSKYHYLLWRPVTAIDPSAVTADGYGSVPGVDDGNPATVEMVGWRPLLPTPNHPEYPSAHGSLTSAMASVFAEALGTNHINLDLHGFDPTGPAGNLNAVHHFATTDDLRAEIVNARVWIGYHYRFSVEAGVKLGQKVAEFDLHHAFQPADD